MIRQSDKDLAAELVKRGILTQKAADQCLAEIQTTADNLNKYLLSHKYASEKQILEALAVVLKTDFIDLKKVEIDKTILSKVPVRVAWYYRIMPIKVEGKTITIASAALLNVKLQDEIRVHLGFEPRINLAMEEDIIDAINKYYGLAADTVNRLTQDFASDPLRLADSSQWIEDLDKEIDDASIAKLVNQIILEAYKKRATDIHIEPYRDKVRFRYRIDGVLVDANIPPSAKEFLPSIISRIKIMADLSIVEKRLPQDGSVVVKTKEQDLDLRISTIPTPRGESMVIRILPTTVRLLSLEKLGLDQKNLKIFRSLVSRPSGIILVTGPTGSGKTTTLYACLNEINSSDRKIITLEDPIECEMEGITQIQVNPKVNMSFATGLRSVLRHDPNIIMVGEIRDLETAEIAIRTALTGHVVFSTLHTNDAASGVTRLIEMGLEPFLVASSVVAFVAQRLVRIICPHCKEEVVTPLLEIKEEIFSSLRLENIEQVKIYNGRGCDYCNQTGYYGRTAIYEILLMTEEVRKAVLEKQQADQIKRLAIEGGMLTLRQDGWHKVVSGITTPTEVMNVTMKDGLLSQLETEQKIIKSYVSSHRSQDLSADSKENADTKTFGEEIRLINRQILSTKNEYDSRAYPRVNDKINIRYSIVRQDPNDTNKFITEKVEHSSVSKDISAGGLRFISGYALRVGTILEIKIQLDKAERSINCLARVCRVEDDTLSAMFNVIVYYLDISSADRFKLNNYVKAKLEEQNQGKE